MDKLFRAIAMSVSAVLALAGVAVGLYAFVLLGANSLKSWGTLPDSLSPLTANQLPIGHIALLVVAIACLSLAGYIFMAVSKRRP